MTIRAVCFQVKTCSDARADAGDAGASDDDDDDDDECGGGATSSSLPLCCGVAPAAHCLIIAYSFPNLLPIPIAYSFPPSFSITYSFFFFKKRKIFFLLIQRIE